MTPNHLHLVAPLSTTVTPPVAVAPKVLNADLMARLALITNAERQLRKLGYAIAWSRLAGHIPSIHIHRESTESITPLLDQAVPNSFLIRRDVDRRVASCEVFGVLVSWIQE